MTAESSRTKLGHARIARVAVAIASFVYAASVLLAVPGYMASGDSLYHFDVSRKIWAGDLAPNPARSFPWTIFAEWPVDHYWGFHLLTAPFAAVRDSEVGMKLAAAFLFAAFLVVLHVIIQRRRAPFAWAWTFASVLFSSQDWRYLQLRGGVFMAAIALAFAEVAFFGDRTRVRRIVIVALAAVASLSYNGALALVPLHVAGIVALAVFERDRARIFEPLLTVVGLAVGLIVNPYMDRKASTFRFAAFHVRYMGADPEGLFAGRDNVEFNPFPLHALWDEWIWSVLLVLVVAGVVLLVLRRRRGQSVERDAVVYGALTVAFVVLTARAVRMREYAVPFGFAFFASVTRPYLEERVKKLSAVRVALGLTVLFLGLGARQWSKSVARIPRVHPPIDLFEGARPILEKHQGVPVANLVRGDSSMLLWEWGDVQAVQGLSSYFVYHRDRALYEDLRTLRENTNETAQKAAIERLRLRGVRLISSRDNLAFTAFGNAHPELVHLVFARGSRLYEILPQPPP